MLVLEPIEQLLDLLVRQSLAQRRQQVSQLSRVDHSAAVLVEDAQAFDEVLLGRLVLLLAQILEYGQELLERDALDVEIFEALFDVRFGWI